MEGKEDQLVTWRCEACNGMGEIEVFPDGQPADVPGETMECAECGGKGCEFAYCDADSCEDEATETVPVSIATPGDDVRHYCPCCYEVYMVGVQHGRICTEAGLKTYEMEVPHVAQKDA